MELKLDNDNYDQLAELFKVYYRQNVTWGSLHVALDDGNIDRNTIQFCKKYAIEHEDWLGALLAEILLQLSDRGLQELKDNGQADFSQVFLFDLNNLWF